MFRIIDMYNNIIRLSGWSPYQFFFLSITTVDFYSILPPSNRLSFYPSSPLPSPSESSYFLYDCMSISLPLRLEKPTLIFSTSFELFSIVPTNLRVTVEWLYLKSNRFFGLPSRIKGKLMVKVAKSLWRRNSNA